MATGGGQGTMMLALELSTLKQLGDLNVAFPDARTWMKYIGVASEKLTYVMTNFTRKEHTRQDFFSGPRGAEESFENVMRQFDTDRHVLIGMSDEDRAVTEETGWKYLPVEDTAEATEWVLVGNDDASADPPEAEGRDDWP